MFTRDVTRCDGYHSHEFDFVLFVLLRFGGFNLVLDVAVFEPLGGGPFGVFFVPFALLSFGDCGLVRDVAVFERLDGVARGVFFDPCFLATDPDFEGAGTWSDCRIFKDFSLSPLYTRTWYSSLS